MIQFREKEYSLLGKVAVAAGKAKTLGYRLATNAGDVANDGIRTVIRKPGTVAGTVAPIPGGTFVGAGLDKVTNKAIPSLPKAKEKAVSWFNKKVAPTTEGIVNGAVNYFKGM